MLAYAIEHFHPRLKTACSFQKEETVLAHMLSEITPDAKLFTIDTGVLFPETLATWKRFEERFGLRDRGDRRRRVRARPGRGRTAAARPRSTGSSGRWPASRPGSPASAASSRRRAPGAPKLERDEKRGIWKLNPLADWSDKDVWNYIFKHDLPYNPLHDHGLRFDRLRALHAARQRSRRPLGGRGQDRVRYSSLVSRDQNRDHDNAG